MGWGLMHKYGVSFFFFSSISDPWCVGRYLSYGYGGYHAGNGSDLGFWWCLVVGCARLTGRKRSKFHDAKIHPLSASNSRQTTNVIYLCGSTTASTLNRPTALGHVRYL